MFKKCIQSMSGLFLASAFLLLWFLISQMFEDKVVVWQRIHHLIAIEQQRLGSYHINISNSRSFLLTDLRRSENTLPSSPAQAFFELMGKLVKTIKSVFDLLRLRFKIMYLFLPLFGLMGVIGFIDGWTQRALRRLKGARESRIRHQLAKSLIWPMLVGSSMCYLALPLSINPSGLFCSFAGLVGITISLAMRTYRKYV
jgi:hypothetical protein